MISQETASRIWECYREIATGEKLLIDMQEAAQDQRNDDHAPQLKDVFGHRRDLQLGVPSGENSHRLFHVGPRLAAAVIRSHIEAKRAELAEANEQARIELTTVGGKKDERRKDHNLDIPGRCCGQREGGR